VIAKKEAKEPAPEKKPIEILKKEETKKATETKAPKKEAKGKEGVDIKEVKDQFYDGECAVNDSEDVESDKDED